MPSQSAMIHVRLDSDLKSRAATALAATGLTAAYAVRPLFHRIARD